MKVLGVLFIMTGLVVGAYVGIWWAFIGGIVDVITQVRADELEPLAVAIGVAKIIFSAFLGWCAAYIFIIPGAVFWKASE